MDYFALGIKQYVCQLGHIESCCGYLVNCQSVGTLGRGHNLFKYLQRIRVDVKEGNWQ